MRVFPRVCEIFLIWPVMCIYGEPFVSDFSPVFLPRSAARRIATVKIFLRISDIILQDRNFINRNKYFFCFICICFQRSIDWQENPNKNIFSFEIAGNWSSLKKENKISRKVKKIYISSWKSIKIFLFILLSDTLQLISANSTWYFSDSMKDHFQGGSQCIGC